MLNIRLSAGSINIMSDQKAGEKGKSYSLNDNFSIQIANLGVSDKSKDPPKTAKTSQHNQQRFGGYVSNLLSYSSYSNAEPREVS